MDEKVREIEEYVRHLRVLCPTSLDVQYFEYLLSNIFTLEAKVEELEEGIEKRIKE